MSTNYQKKAVASIKWMTIAEVAAKLIVPITNMILARLLAPEVFGLVASISVITTFAEMVSESGFSSYILQQKFASEDVKRKSAGTATVVSVALSLVIFAIVALCKDPLAKLVNAEGYGYVLLFAASQIPFYAITSIQMSLFRRDFKFGKLAIVRLASCVSQLLVASVCAFLGFGIWSIPAGTLGSLVCQFALMIIFNRKSFVFSFSKESFKEMWACSSMFLLSSIVVWADYSINTLFAGWMLGQSEAGFIKNGFSTAAGIISMLTAIYSPVLISLLAKMEVGSDEYKEVFYKYQKALSSLFIPLGVGMFVFQSFLAFLFFGEGWEPAAIALGCQGLVGCIRVSTGNFMITAWSAQGKPLWIILGDLFSTVCLSLAWVLTRGLEFHVIVIVVSLAYLPTNVFCFALCKKTLKLSPWPVFINAFKVALPAVLMGLVGFFLLEIYDSHWASIAYVIICIVYYFSWTIVVFPDFVQALLEVFVSTKLPRAFRHKNGLVLVSRKI
ncbi:MAG: oligosaccharide flippase family protein [Firmicutes bacterium]|uniref:Oligosaccharide flippase family protein n=1 Tax=Candidatus Alloenteromonas pullistercoris TaxID=2840785 RepID=A0A9D9DDY4_9FIRM|nr:oligosaccharide flippase family protein [Candidatus Enteromonas pullistercoris]